MSKHNSLGMRLISGLLSVSLVVTGSPTLPQYALATEDAPEAALSETIQDETAQKSGEVADPTLSQTADPAGGESLDDAIEVESPEDALEDSDVPLDETLSDDEPLENDASADTDDAAVQEDTTIEVPDADAIAKGENAILEDEASGAQVVESSAAEPVKKGADALLAQANTPQPLSQDNLSLSYATNSSLVSLADGYLRVFYDGSAVFVEKYDLKFSLQSRRQIPKELKYYGGFYSGSDAYYFVFGQANEAENTSAEVVRVVKYSKSWQRLGAASLTGDDAFAHEIRYPFDCATTEIAESRGTLYIVTGHEGYVDDEFGMGHQGFLMFAVDEATMQGKIVNADLWHSFSQHITIDDDVIYVLEESEGSRMAKVTRKTRDDYGGTAIPVLQYGGSRTSSWAIATYASADDIVTSQNNILTVGTSIDQSKFESGPRKYNVYLTVTPKNNFSEEATTFKWLTADNLDYPYAGVRITKINDNRFMISWRHGESDEQSLATSEYDPLSSHVLHYLFVDGNGNVLSKEYKVAAAFSDCEPVVRGSQVITYASNAGAVSFYTISTDLSSSKLDKTTTLLAGADATWSFANGVVTISGRGAISQNFAEQALSAVKDKVKKIIIRPGITTVSANAFSYLPNVKTILIAKTVTSIGESAFYGISQSYDVYVPASVKSIAADAFDSGWFWRDEAHTPVVDARLWCLSGSVAHTFAKEHYAGFQLVSAKLSNRTVTYSGKVMKIRAAKLLGTTGKVTYTYYTNKTCTKKTTVKTHGAAKAGGAPKRAGTYYVKARVAADMTFDKITSNRAKLVIKKKSQKVILAQTKFSVKAKALKTQKKTFRLKAKSAAKAGATFKKISGDARIKVGSKGNLIVPKEMAKGTYKVKVKVAVKGNANYKAASKTITCKVIVK